MKRIAVPARATSPLLHPATGTDYREPVYVDRRGRPRYAIGGAAEPDPEDPPKNDPDPEDPPKTFTQDELTRIAAKEKRDGKSAGQLELAKDLGFDSVDDMKAAAQKQREAEDKAKTDAERAADEAKRARAEADQEKREAAAERRAASIERVLNRLGAKEDDLDDAAVLLATKLKADADKDDILEAAEALKTRRPELFGEDAEPEPTKRPAARLPKGKPTEPKKPAAAEVGQAGLDRARRKGWVE